MFGGRKRIRGVIGNSNISPPNLKSTRNCLTDRKAEGRSNMYLWLVTKLILP